MVDCQRDGENACLFGLSLMLSSGDVPIFMQNVRRLPGLFQLLRTQKHRCQITESVCKCRMF